MCLSVLTCSDTRRQIVCTRVGKIVSSFAEDSALSSIALMAWSMMQPLLIQKPHWNSHAKDHSAHLLRRLEMWSKGSFGALLREGHCIQDHLLPSKKSYDRSRLFDSDGRYQDFQNDTISIRY